MPLSFLFHYNHFFFGLSRTMWKNSIKIPLHPYISLFFLWILTSLDIVHIGVPWWQGATTTDKKHFPLVSSVRLKKETITQTVKFVLSVCLLFPHFLIILFEILTLHQRLFFRASVALLQRIIPLIRREFPRLFH